MNLGIQDQLFVVGGATSGFGKAIATALLQEGAHIIGVARNKEKLEALQATAPCRAEILPGDITDPAFTESLMAAIGSRTLHGMLVNAAGPPAKTFLETSLADWDKAYHDLLRWKVHITQAVIPRLTEHHYGRLLYIESASVKQPMENLVLSNALRLAVVGFVKTLSQEVASSGITLNVLAPGSHNTPAVERVYAKKALQQGITDAAAREAGINQIPVKTLGKPEDFASLALWLLSPLSGYITGQTITVDGGTVKNIFG